MCAIRSYCFLLPGIEVSEMHRLCGWYALIQVILYSVVNDNDNEVYFTLATSNSQIDKYRTVIVETQMKTTKYNAKKENDCVGRVKFVVSRYFLIII